MTNLLLGVLAGLVLGQLLRGRFTYRNSKPRSHPPARGYRPQKPTSKPTGPAPIPPPVGRRTMHGPNYNPKPPDAVKPPPPPAPPLKRFAVPTVRVDLTEAEDELQPPRDWLDPPPAWPPVPEPWPDPPEIEVNFVPLEDVELVAVLDEHTCVHCREGHGQVFERFAFESLAVHSNGCMNPDGCRCNLRVSGPRGGVD